MKVDHYRLIEFCVENGIRSGLRRVHKYAEDPTDDEIIEKIRQEVMAEIAEWFKFEEIQ